MASEVSAPREYGLGKTERRDSWWVGPLATALGFGAFILYSTFRAIYNDDYVSFEDRAGWGELLSPFYSPLPPESIRGLLPFWFSPAFLILWAPGGFRLTCYYYRKAYYRAYFLDPPACAVGESRSKYRGETRLFLFQNLHRYFLYFALLFLVLLSIDVVRACVFESKGGGMTFGVSVGSLVLLANVTLLSMYTFSCHSLRHLVGGNIDCFSCVAFGKGRYKLWKGISFLNKNHMLWAWVSLFMVGFADFYVWMVASGTIPEDPRIF
jgi:hypothetical protein